MILLYILFGLTGQLSLVGEDKVGGAYNAIQLNVGGLCELIYSSLGGVDRPSEPTFATAPCPSPQHK